MSSDDITSEPNPETTPSAIPSESSAEATPVAPPHFQTEPFVPDGNFPPLGLALTLGGGLAAAVLVGFLASVIGQWFYLVILFPCLIGAALGGVGMAFIKIGKLRNPLLAGIAAGLSGIMAMGTMHYVNYQRALDAVAKKLPVDRDKLEEHIGFAKYLDLNAQEGVTIGRAARNDKGMNLGYAGSYIYWLAEIFVVAGVAWVMMRKTAAAPFCADCNTWKNEQPLAMVMAPSEELAVRAVEEGDVVSLLPFAGPIQTEGLLLKTAVCPRCGADGEVDVALDRLTKNSKGQQQTTTVTRTTYPGELLRFLSGDSAETTP
jgi:hypothetical protein